MKTEIPPVLALLRDWSIWLVSLQTGALGVASFVMGKGTSLHLSTRWLKWALLCFALSIVFASFVLAGLPDIALRMPASAPIKPVDFYDMSIFDQPSWSLFSHTPVWIYTSGQHWFFIFGLAFVLVAIWRGNRDSRHR